METTECRAQEHASHRLKGPGVHNALNAGLRSAQQSVQRSGLGNAQIVGVSSV